MPNSMTMGGVGLSVADVQGWSADGVREVFHVGQNLASSTADVSRALAQLKAFESWGGDAAEAAMSSIALTRQDLDALGNELVTVADAARAAADEIEDVQSRLRALLSRAEDLGLVVDLNSNQVSTTSSAIGGPMAGLINAMDLQQDLDALLRDADAIDDLLASAIDMADGDSVIPGLPGQSGIPTDVLQAQIEAFKKTYGRLPTSASDWEAASWLDPQNFDPALKGADSSVVVAQIMPVPGQGVVRGSLFIMDEKVVDPFAPDGFDPSAYTSLYDYGNDRGFSTNFDPRNAKGAFLIDYENGVVIFRQNPTHDTAGHVTIGTPDVRVSQAGDGALRMDYNLPNPAAMLGPLNTAELSGKPVAGTVLVAPQSGGPTASGFIGDYPSAEIYADSPGGESRVLLQDEQDNRSPLGPVLELGSYHFVGELPAPAVQEELGFSPTHTTFIGPGATGQIEQPINQPTINPRGTRLTPP